MKWFDMLHRFLERRRMHVVGRDLMRHHSIDITEALRAVAEQRTTPCVDCPPETPDETEQIAQYMHQQSHALHVQMFRAQKLAAKFNGEVVEDGDQRFMPMRAARRS